jgi:hypothetical protein
MLQVRAVLAAEKTEFTPCVVKDTVLLVTSVLLLFFSWF